MTNLRQGLARLISFFRKQHLDQEFDEEIAAHVEFATQDFIRQGSTLPEARRLALIKLGGIEPSKELHRDSRGLPWLDGVCQDLLYAWRTMAKRPVFTATVATTLALGIGASTAVFTIVDAVLLEPLPYKDPSRLVVVWDKNLRDSAISKMFDSFQDFREMATHARVFEQVAAATWAVQERLISGHGSTREILAMPVSESFFSLLGISAARGRTFTLDDLKQGCSVVLSDRLWQKPLGADPKLIGNSLRLDDQACTVVGVMPPDFAFYPDAVALWVLITPNFSPPPDQLPVGIFGRLKPGISVAQAQAEISGLHAALHRDDGKEHDIVPAVNDLQGEFTFLAEVGLKTTLWVLLVAVSFVLLVACLNIANLMLGQGLEREREFAVRSALGGGRGRLVRQLLTESLLLASIGGALGLGIAFAAVRYFHAINPIEMPIGAHVELNWSVLSFTAATSLVTAVLFGLLPSFKASRTDVMEGLRAGGRSISSAPLRLINGLIAAEMALSLILLAGAGLLMKSLLTMDSEPLGFRPEGLNVTTITLPATHYPDAARRLQFYKQLITKLGDRAALATVLPPYGAGSSVLRVENKPVSPNSERHDVGKRTVTPGYFEVLGGRLLRGRTFNWRDQVATTPVAIVNEAILNEYFAGSDPIGQRIRVGEPSEKNPWRTIVGVVANEKSSRNYHQIGWAERGTVFDPLAQDPPRSVSIAMRGSGGDLGRAITSIDASVAIGDIETMWARLGRGLAYPKFRAVLLGAFAVFSVLLAAIGLYGVLGQFVAQRTREIGVRMAVGATSANVLQLVLLQAARPLVLGLTAGLLGAGALGRYLASLLYGVRPTDPITFGLVSVSLIFVAGFATFLPTLRAIRVDPMETLRNE